MEDDLKKIQNGRQPQKNKNGRQSQQKYFSIPLKLRGKPFLGLAQLSKIFVTAQLNLNWSWSLT
jgi:hypothetical protein